MASIFPLDPEINDEFQGYRYNGVSWKIIGIDLTADYPEITGGFISDTVVPVTIARVSDVDTSLGDYIPLNTKGEPLGVAELNASGFVPSSQLDINLSGYATESYVGTAISNLIDAAPTTLDTLNELAAALSDDPNYATTISTALGNKLDSSTAASTYQPIGSYLTSYTETDPIFIASEAYGITSTDTTNWDAAYGWGNHASAGYLTTSTASSTYQPLVSGVSNTEIGYLDGVTSAIQTQINSKLSTITASETYLTQANASTTYQPIVANVSNTEIGYLDGVTSSIQTQIDSKLSTSTASTTYVPQSTASANQILFKNSSNVAFGNSSLTFDGNNLKVNGNLESIYSVGDHGGEIFLNKGTTNTTLNTGVTIDVWQNKLRIFESGGTSRGAYINLTSLEANTGTNLTPVPGIFAFPSITGAFNSVLVGKIDPETSTAVMDIAATDLSLNIVPDESPTKVATRFINLNALTYPGDSRYLTTNGEDVNAPSGKTTILLADRATHLIEIEAMIYALPDTKNSIPAGSKTIRYIATVVVDDNNGSGTTTGTIVGATTTTIHETTTPSMSGYTIAVTLGSSVSFSGSVNKHIPVRVQAIHSSGTPLPGAAMFAAAVKVMQSAYR